MAVPNFKDNFFSMSPRLQGIEEQFERAKLFFNEGVKSTDKLDRFRRFVATIYFAGAIAEIMLDAAKNKEVNVSKKALEKILIAKLPRCMLVIKLRIHDFHRFGLLERAGVFMGGPVKLTASKGMIQVQYTAQGPVVTKTGNSKFEEQRPVLMCGDKVFDEEERAYVSLQKVLSDYLAAVPEVIEEFRKLQEKKSG